MTSSQAQQEAPGARRRAAGSPTSRSAGGLLTAAFKQYSADNLGDRAAALTYYGVLAMFPALIALVGLVGLVADPVGTTRTLTSIVTKIGVASSATTFAGPIHSLTAHRATAGIVGLVGLLGALWGASGYVGAFMRASNVIYETPEGRPFWKLRPLQLLITVVMLVLLVVVALALLLTGPIVTVVANPLGIGSTAVSVWNIAKWPVLAVIITGMFAVLFYASPNAKLASLRWVAPGVLSAMIVWLIASGAFALYVSQFSSYNKTYGTLAGVVVFLVWLWISNVALLLGMELNAERERNREIEQGVPGAHRELQVTPRTPPKRTKQS